MTGVDMQQPALRNIFSLGTCDLFIKKSIWDVIGQSFVGICGQTMQQILKDQFIQSWYSNKLNSSKGQFYSSFKTKFKLENYFKKLKKKRRQSDEKFRCRNIRFPIESGR